MGNLDRNSYELGYSDAITESKEAIAALVSEGNFTVEQIYKVLDLLLETV